MGCSCGQTSPNSPSSFSTLGLWYNTVRVEPYSYVGILTPIVESQMEKNMKHEMETGAILYDPKYLG